MSLYDRISTIGTRLFTWRRGEFVGADEFGNRYFRDKRGPQPRMSGAKRERRWVMYQGEAEATKVPPEWHAWLHHQSQEPPSESSPYRRPWQKEHVPNLTGTELAYRPPGSMLKGEKRARSGSDYEPWTPS